MIEELSRMAWIFARFQDNQLKEAAKEQGWTLETISKIQGKVQASTDMANKIKDEIIGDGDEAKFVGRTKTTFFELNGKPSFAPSYYPEFDEACFELPSKEHPDRNKELADALLLVYGDDAAMIMVRLGATFKMANFIVQDVCSMLGEVSRFVGYNPEPQQGEMPKELNTPEAKMYLAKAIELGLMDNNNNWLKGLQMLACFAREMSLKLKLGKGERISWKPFETLFNVPVGKLRLNYNDIQKTGQAPKEVYLIDKVFG